MEEQISEITVFSDYICPFCFIGKHRLKELAEEFPFRAVWRPLEIHPETPPQGISIDRFPGEMLERLEASVQSLANEMKISIRAPQKLSNSRLALLGGEIAREAGGFEQYHEAVFHAYFQLGEDIGDLAVLLRIAEGAGIGADEFQKSLGEKRFVESLKTAHREAHSRGIAAVPSFVLLNGGIITGVQAYGVMKNMIQQSIDPELQKGESCC